MQGQLTYKESESCGLDVCLLFSTDPHTIFFFSSHDILSVLGSGQIFCACMCTYGGM